MSEWLYQPLGVQSTFFVSMDSALYNPFAANSHSEGIGALQSLGHIIGLHPRIPSQLPEDSLLKRQRAETELRVNRVYGHRLPAGISEAEMQVPRCDTSRTGYLIGLWGFGGGK